VGVAAESIVLEHGTVVSSIHPRGDAPPFRVVAGNYEVRVIGTLFQVSRTGDQVDVRVREGKVEVRGPKGTTLVGAGESFSSRGGAVAPIASEAVNLLGGHSPVSMVREAEPHPDREPPVIAKARPRPRLDRRAAPTQPPPTEPAPDSAEEPSATPELVEPEPAAETAPVAEGDKYVEAVGSEDTERAITLFDELVASGGPRAELAAYQAARLSRSRDLNEAVQRYEHLLSTHPSGVFGQEARLDVIECAMQLGKWDKASYHIDVFLDAYPGSERTAEVHFLRAEVARRGHDCAAAIPDYDAALSSPRRVGDAMFFKAWCLLSHEKADEALPYLERYLERFPTGRHATEARKRVTEIRALKND
jgi:TolA-binding protein